MSNAKIDDNWNPTVTAVSTADGTTPVRLEANPSTGALLIESSAGGNEVTTRLDDYTTTKVTYVGKAAIGSASNSPVWQIMKMDETTGLVTTWADGNSNFDNNWDNHTSLTYS
jgi:hypothetical protein